MASGKTWRCWPGALDVNCTIAVDGNHQIIACELTTPETGDPTAVPDLLDQTDTPFEIFMGDGAYDGDPAALALLKKQPNAQAIVPPHKTAVISANGDTQRDDHIRVIGSYGRIAWQKKTSHGLRTLPNLPCNDISVFLATR